jgi:hypothetical protein
MKNYSLRQLSAPDLTRGLASSIANERVCTTRVLAYIAEFDRRRYRPRRQRQRPPMSRKRHVN